MFNRYGTVVDVYIAKKINRLKKFFGFVRFIRVQEIPSFEKRLSVIYIGAQKIDVNVARFDRNKHENRGSNPSVTQEIPSMQQFKQAKSFDDAVRGTSPTVNDGSGKRITGIEGSKTPRKIIKMESHSGAIECMENTLVGEVENFQALMNVKAFQEVEGCPMIQLRYLGGT